MEYVNCIQAYLRQSAVRYLLQYYFHLLFFTSHRMHTSVKSPTLLWQGWFCAKSVHCGDRNQFFGQRIGQDHGMQGFTCQLGFLISMWACTEDTVMGC